MGLLLSTMNHNLKRMNEKWISLSKEKEVKTEISDFIINSEMPLIACINQNSPLLEHYKFCFSKAKDKRVIYNKDSTYIIRNNDVLIELSQLPTKKYPNMLLIKYNTNQLGKEWKDRVERKYFTPKN